ncbi:invasion associated locus B family protein [Bradyrhizobium sp. ARR65]|uniref:invasion associated locus B family protein n=1 Tax=Bradyrhizobium sp. ARR65 TaxID=1040989 RepID=UPI0005562EAD|nr:invasion associated locus B family protein [Bradyrhizobium sp. ARR65]
MSSRNSPPIESPSLFMIALSSLLLLLALWSVALADEANQTSGTAAAQKAPEATVAPRGQRMARDIRYGEWRKVCFKTPGANTVCRTSISGTWDTGQTAVRADLIEREGEGAARLQLFLPVGLYLPAGVKLTVDQGVAYQIPYVWCLTNTCIAAQVANPKLVEQMEAGQKLSLEVVDSNVLAVTTTLPLAQFAAAHDNAPTQTFQQDVDE